MNPTRTIKLSGEKFSFSASHAIVFEQPNQPGSLGVEPLHGHDFVVDVEITGPVNALGMVINFLIAESVLRSIIDKFNHKILLPAKPEYFNYEQSGRQLGVRSKVDPRSWSFPMVDVCFIDAPNASTEAIADDLARLYWSRLTEFGIISPAEAYRLRVTLKESAGSSVTVEY